MKPKKAHKADAYIPQGVDRCYTPAYALDPLLPYLRKTWTIWEPCAGQGHIVRTLEQQGFGVAASELACRDPLLRVSSNPIAYGVNFLACLPPKHSAVVTNPPYSIKGKIVERCYDLGKPFALLLPVEAIGTWAVQQHMERHGAELLLLNRRVNFIMPNIGWGNGDKKSAAQFPVLWLCHKVLPRPIVYGKIVPRPDAQEVLV